MHLVFEASGAGIQGGDRSLFARRLSGRDMVLGVRFRAGCFRPFGTRPSHSSATGWSPATSGLPDRYPVAEQADHVVALITSDSALQRVDQLSVASGLSVRSLQRLFADYVAVSPKWVMRWPGCTRRPLSVRGLTKSPT